ncbi:MAG: hypothetical protein LC130_10760 [Bryobacterales bacterium]|nr:hypothetical protein [Bryobacterales bacterium]
MGKTFEQLRDEFAGQVADGLKAETSRIERLSSLAYEALIAKADAASDQTKRADEIATGIADIKAKSGVQPPMIREYAKLGFLLKDVPSLVSVAGGRAARVVCRVVEFDKSGGCWKINANHLERIKEWIAADMPHDVKAAEAVRDDCGKAPAPRAKKAKDEPPAPGPLPVNDDSVGAYFASRATEGVIDDMIEQASPDQRGLIGEALGRHMSSECFLRMVRDYLFAHGEEPDCLLALYEIGKDLELAQSIKIMEGFAASALDDGKEGGKRFSDYCRAVKAQRNQWSAEPVAA